MLRDCDCGTDREIDHAADCIRNDWPEETEEDRVRDHRDL